MACINGGIMNRTIDPKQFGLPVKTVLERIDTGTIAVVVDRKSRIIMADGKKIAAKAGKIKEAMPTMAIALRTSAPVCGKTIKFLEGEGIQVIRGK